MARNAATVTLVREPWQVPALLALADAQVVPLNAGETINWKLV